MIKVFDLAALVLLGAVVVQMVGAVVAAAGFPSSNLPGTPSVPVYSRLFSATIWANVPTGLLLLASLAVVAVPRMVWDIPSKDQWPGVAPAITGVLCGVAALTVAAGLAAIGNFIWNTPQRNPLDSWNVAEALAAVAVSGLVAILAWFAIPYVRRDASAA